MILHHIVVLDNYTNPEQLTERLKDATIAITSNSRVTKAGIDAAAQLQLIASNATGTNHIANEAARERKVMVCHVSAQNTDSVAEHASALYYALKRQIIPMHNLTMDGGTWSQGAAFRSFLKPPRTNAEETLVVIGYDAISKKIQAIGTALGMRILVAERKDASSIHEDRVSSGEAIRQGTVFMAAAPLDAATQGMLGASEFEAMDPTAVVINVGQCGILDEQALVEALKGGQIDGAATDAFETAATNDNCLLLDPGIPNLVLSPHIAWYSSKTLRGTETLVKANLEAFVAGSPINVVH